MASKLIKVILYEDNPDMREGLSTLLSITEGFELVGAFVNCEDADEHTASLNPDVVMMDFDMPAVNGIEGIKLIRKINSDVRIIMLTVFEDNHNVFDAICAGANGYLLKKSTPEQIIEAIHESLKGGSPMSGNIASKVLAMLADSKLSVPEKKDYGLTQREKEILFSLAKGNSYKMIADEYKISMDTVKTHLKKIYQKLQVHSQTEAVIKALNQKIV